MKAKITTRDLILTALFAALTAVGAFVKIPFAFSAITLQFFFTAMAGILLGARLGALSQLVYVLLGLLGLPIFTLGGGIGYFLYPTCGFLLGLIPAAWVTGKLTEKKADFKHIALGALAGLGILYLFGLPYMALTLNVYMGKGMSLWAILMAGTIPFLPGDFVKIIVCGLLCPPLTRRLRQTVHGD
ncbi:MAG: biotin transporter BioY [Clostridiales bacterium]|nr:biotin transporter BioY [Clostridiales bacterium]